MARSEARLSVSVWTDPDFLALTPTAQRMFMFLLSQPDLAHDGVIALRERRWSKTAATLTPAQVAQDLEELRAARFVVIDEDTEELLIRSFIRRDKVYRQPNVLRAAEDHLGVVTSLRILEAIALELRRIQVEEEMVEASAEIIVKMLAAIEKGIGNPSANPSRKGFEEGLPNPSDEGSEDPSAGTPGERGVVTAVSSDSPFLVPRSPDPLPAPAAPDARETRGKRGTRIPDDFKVTPEMVAWANERVPHVNGRLETEKFINHWRSKTRDATKLDWAATWRNWMLTAAERLPATTGRSSGANRHVDQLSPEERKARNPLIGAVHASQVASGGAQ